MLSARKRQPPSSILGSPVRPRCLGCKVLEGFAQEEAKHKAKLEAIKAGGTFKASTQQVADLKIADYQVDVEASPGMDYKDALAVAMKKEKAAFKLYTDLAASAADENVKATFLALAQEEARHKLRFEVEYDDLLTENQPARQAPPADRARALCKSTPADYSTPSGAAAGRIVCEHVAAARTPELTAGRVDDANQELRNDRKMGWGACFAAGRLQSTRRIADLGADQRLGCSA